MSERCRVRGLGLGLLFAAAVAPTGSQAAPPLPPPEPPAQVTHQGFCLHRVELRCLEVVLPASAPVEFDRLPRLADGRRGIYFFADAVAKPKAVFVLALEALDEDADLRIDTPEAAGMGAPPPAPALQALGRKLGPSGALELTPVRGTGGVEPVRVFAAIPIEGPGEFAARVVDLDGAMLPGSSRMTMSVMISGGSPPH
jgi:hypothetical protein